MSNSISLVILYGGQSVEHEVSIRSAKNVYEYADHDRFNITCIGITKTGSWHLTDGITTDIESGKAVDLILKPNVGFKTDNTTVQPDVVFPVLHGTDGEDGSIQGLLTAMNFPFVGSGVLGSSVSMNKLFTKRMLRAADLPVGDFISFSREEEKAVQFDEVQSLIGLPFMAKAASLGSSVGVYKVKNEAEFKHAVESIFKFDNVILCEEFISGRELECSVMGNKHVKTSKPAEIVINDNYEFYTYEAKYEDPNAVRLDVPANLDDAIAEEIRELSAKAYVVAGCEDFARVDLFLTEENRIVLNEINTIPGFTNASMFPMMWKEQGISFTALISELVDLALERHELNKQLIKHYSPEGN